MPAPVRNIRKFLPKGPYVGESKGLRATKAVLPGKTKNPARARASFEKHGITDFKAKPIKPLSIRKNAELKKKLGLDRNNNVAFYRDNRNLFIFIEHPGPKSKNLNSITIRRVKRSGGVEIEPYAEIEYFIYKGGKPHISSADLNDRFISSEKWDKRFVPLNAAPKPEHSGRGIMSAVVDFMGKRGSTEISITALPESERAYRRAGFREKGGYMVWRKEK